MQGSSVIQTLNPKSSQVFVIERYEAKLPSFFFLAGMLLRNFSLLTHIWVYDN